MTEKDKTDEKETWLSFLTQGGMRAQDSERIDTESLASDVYAWADDVFYKGDICDKMREKIELHKKKIREEATSHDKICNAHHNLLRLAFEGHLGWRQALKEINNFWGNDVLKRDKRNISELKSEIWRSATNELRKIKAESDERVKIGAKPLDPRCECGVEVNKNGNILKPVNQYERDDRGNAQHMYDMFGDVIRYIDGLGWIVWNDDHWETDINGDNQVQQLWNKVHDRQLKYVALLKRMLDNEIDIATKASLPITGSGQAVPNSLVRIRTKYTTWFRFVEDCGNWGRFNRMMGKLKGFNVQLDASELDQNPYLLGVGNGIVELDREDVRLREARIDDYITLNTHINWEEPSDFARQKWNEYLETFLPNSELRQITQIALGHCLIGGNPEKIMIILKGAPDTGKSTMVNALEAGLGDYITAVNQSVFQQHKLNPILADALPKRIIICSEFDENDILSSSTIKRLSGNDKVRVELKGSNARIERVPQFVSIVPTNETFTIRGVDKALQNRLYVIPFNVTPKHIMKEYGNIIKAVCGPAVLGWLIDGYKEYRRLGGLSQSKIVQDETEEFMSELDEIARFTYECVKKHDDFDKAIDWSESPDWIVKREAMYSHFQCWWRENNFQDFRMPSAIALTKRLKALGFSGSLGNRPRTIGGQTARWWYGVRLVQISSNVSSIQIKIKPEK